MTGFWSIEHVADSHELWVDQTPSSPGLVPSRQAPVGRTQWLDPVTAILIWTLPVVEVDEITEQNLDDTFLRVRMLELARGGASAHHRRQASLYRAEGPPKEDRPAGGRRHLYDSAGGHPDQGAPQSSASGLEGINISSLNGPSIHGNHPQKTHRGRPPARGD